MEGVNSKNKIVKMAEPLKAMYQSDHVTRLYIYN